MGKRLQKDFYARDTIDVARDLLGQKLVHIPPRGPKLSGLIVETEAYLGAEDPAAHSFNDRRTPRTEPMFADPGTSYIYFIYGVHYCFNVVTMAKDVPEAVLIRAVHPLDGIEDMLARRPNLPLEKIANGPGKLCLALQLGRAQNALDLTTSNEVWIEEDGALKDGVLIEGPRVGIGNIHDAVHWPLRFGIQDHPSLSPPHFPV